MEKQTAPKIWMDHLDGLHKWSSWIEMVDGETDNPILTINKKMVHVNKLNAALELGAVRFTICHLHPDDPFV